MYTGHKLLSSDEAFQRRAVQSSYKCGEPESGDMIKIPVSSLSSTASCTSINSLRKASEGRTGRSSFLPDNGSSSLRSDVDELKEELAALRHRLAAEEEEAKRLREEVYDNDCVSLLHTRSHDYISLLHTRNQIQLILNTTSDCFLKVNYLRSCGVLHKPENYYQAQASKSRETLFPQDSKPLSICDDATDMRKQQNRDRSVKQFQRCFSGPLSWTGSLDESLSLPWDASIG
jgi:hypothetical protein